MYHDFRALDPSKYLDEVSPGRTATVVVAAVDSSLQARAQADFVCDGVNDHIEIQAALNALPAAGGEVFLLEGTYNVEATINLDSNQTLRGCGRNTILNTSTAALVFLQAAGVSDTEKTHIVIADLQIDGGAGKVSDCGIYFEYVDYSFIQNVYSRRHASGGATQVGIFLANSHFNQIVNNTCQGNGDVGIYLDTSNNNTISGNTCQGNSSSGIFFDTSSNNTISGNTCQGNSSSGIWLYDLSNNNTISGNTCQGNGKGIFLWICNNNTISGNTCQGSGSGGIYLDTSNNNTISGNICQGNAGRGIFLQVSSNNTISGNTCQGSGNNGIYLATGNNNTIIGNTCVANSQIKTNLYDDIHVENDSNYNNIQGNTCRSPTIGTTLTVGELTGATDIRVTDETDFEVGLGVVIDLGGLNEEYHYISAITAGIITIDAPLVNNQGAGETIDVPSVRYGISISDATCDGNLVTNNDLYNDGFGTAPFNDVGIGTTVTDDNRGLEITQIKHLRYAKNTSGGALIAGDVVSLKAVAAGNEFTTPAAVGEDQVYGMLAENIANNASGYVQVKGGTVLLKATNTGGNIAIGDFLCTEAGGTRARLAAAGDQAFARALETCDAADEVIDAYIKSPWD